MIKERDEKGRIVVRPLAVRFWEKVRVLENNGCWEWQGALFSNGYGLISDTYRRKSFLAHRVSYELLYGPFPKHLLVLHRCDNHKCVKPGHLFLGTHADNLADMDSKGRRVNGPPRLGEENYATKLTVEQVLSIRKEYIPHKVTRIFLARKYKVSLPLVQKILSRKLWKHI